MSLFTINYSLAEVVSQTSNPNASVQARAVQAYLAALSNNSISGVIAGQNAGHSADITNSTGFTGYIPLITSLIKLTNNLKNQ